MNIKFVQLSLEMVPAIISEGWELFPIILFPSEQSSGM